MGPGRVRTARSIAAGGVLCAALALFAGGGCELAVGDTVPAFECDPTAGACPNGQVCSPATHRCVDSCLTNGCLNGAQCNQGTGLCVVADASVQDTSPFDVRPTVDVFEAAPVEAEASAPETGGEDAGPCAATTGKPVGCPCSGAADCSSNICGQEQTLGTGLWSAEGMTSFCTEPCCTSADCPSNAVCYGSGAGGNYCVLPSWLGRNDGVAASTAIGGTACAMGRDCRSGLCDTSASKCADTCCSTASTGECTNGTACVFGAFPGSSFDTNVVPNCGATAGSHSNDYFCDTSNGTCKSDLCFNGYCADACRTGTDCASDDRCTYLEPTGTPDIAAGCVQAMGTIATGATCDPTNDECATGFCGGPTGSTTCLSVCFTSADCGGSPCVPTEITFYVMGTAAGSYSVLACSNGT
jgi:hypothetical protein